MKKLTSIFAALFFAIIAVFAQESKSVEIDLVAGTVKSGLSKSIVWTTDSIQITQESRSLTGTQGAAGAVDVTDVSKPKLTDGQNFVFKTTSLAYPQIINIDITYEGTNYGGLVVGTARSGGKVTADPKCVTTPSTAENGTHKIKIIGGAQQLYVQNYNATPLHVTKIVVTCAVAGYVEQEEAQTDTATVTSMQEVNDSLVSVNMDKEKLAKQKEIQALEQKDFTLSQLKYDNGVIAKLDLNQRQENLLSVNQMIYASEFDCMIDYISYYKAVGAKA